jgi:hypothetical protein
MSCTDSVIFISLHFTAIFFNDLMIFTSLHFTAIFFNDLMICLEGLEKNRERVADVLAEIRTGHLLFKNQKRDTPLDYCGDWKLLKEDALPSYHGGESSRLWHRLVW